MRLLALSAFALFVAPALAIGCGSSSGDAVGEEDSAFTRDYVDDYENDVDEDVAQADEQARLDTLDDLDDVEVLDDDTSSAPTTGATTQSLSTPGVSTKGTRPKHLPHGPVSIMEDDPHFTGDTWVDGNARDNIVDPAKSKAAFDEAWGLGVRYVRVMMMWRNTLQRDLDPNSETRPSFDQTNPDNYDWRRYDEAIDNARARGMSVLITLAAPMPYWASETPHACTVLNSWSCGIKPDVRIYARWVTAVARHYKQKGTRIWGWTIWNEPNIGAFLTDDNDFDRGMRYRKMWFAARKAIRKTAGVRARVLFGDIARGAKNAENARWEMFRFALCLDRAGRPLTGAKFAACPDRSRVVHSPGIALHPYPAPNDTPTDFTNAITTMESIIDEAERDHHLSAGRGLYLTEGGVLTDLPGRTGDLGQTNGVVSFATQAKYINQQDHIAFEHRGRVRMQAQYELYDDHPSAWDCGLIANDGTPKPALTAYQVGIDVSRTSTGRAHVWTLAREAFGNPVAIEGQAANGTWSIVGGIGTDPLGYGEKDFDGAGIVAWRAKYLDVEGRVAATP